MEELVGIVRLDLEVVVKLPEGIKDDGEGNPLPETRERLIEAALTALPQHVVVFVDGTVAPPADVWSDASEDFNVEEVRIEPE